MFFIDSDVIRRYPLRQVCFYIYDKKLGINNKPCGTRQHWGGPIDKCLDCCW